MTLDRDFFPARVLEDRVFLRAIASSVLCAMLAVFGAAIGFNWGKIIIDPVAEVSFLPEAAARTNYVMRISEITGATKSFNPDSVWGGYVAKLFDVCQTQVATGLMQKKSPNDTVILVRDLTNQTLTAAKVNFGSNLCDALQKKSNKDELYATSDVPFVDVRYEKRFIVLDASLKSGSKAD